MLRKLFILLFTAGLVGMFIVPSASATAPTKAKKYLVCSWETTNRDGTYDCDVTKIVNNTVATKLYTCWNGEAVGAIAQEKVGGGWRDRPDIPVTFAQDDWNCEAGFTFATIMTVSVPTTPKYKVYTYRIFVPERPGWQSMVGIPSKVCAKPLSDDHDC